MENRHGLLVDIAITEATLAEPQAGAALVVDGGRPEVACARSAPTRTITPRRSEAAARPRHCPAHRPHRCPRHPGLRCPHHPAQRLCHGQRKRIEEIFGWMKPIGGWRKTRFIGQAKTQMAAYLVGAAYHLLRMARLYTAATG
jgi:hypothetical protein